MRSRRVPVFLAFGVGLACLLSGRPARADVVRGVLRSVDARSQQIVVTDADGDHNALTVASTARITLNGVRARLAGLRAGDRVAVVFQEDARGRATATSIAAARAKSPRS